MSVAQCSGLRSFGKQLNELETNDENIHEKKPNPIKRFNEWFEKEEIKVHVDKSTCALSSKSCMIVKKGSTSEIQFTHW